MRVFSAQRTSLGAVFAAHTRVPGLHLTKKYAPYAKQRRGEKGQRSRRRGGSTPRRAYTTSPHAATMGKAEARALAANYMSRIVDPVINPAICYVRMQKPKPDRCCECILDYLKSLQDGDPLSPDRSSLKKPNVAIPDDQSQIIAKCLAEVIGQQPSKDEVLGLLVKAFEKAVEG